MKKGIFIILDGLGDRPCSLLEDKTPLEAANTPFMDSLVTGGACGLVDPLSPGVPVDTHTGCGALMGIITEDVRQLTRGPVEAAGIGLDFQTGDILMRSNFATLGDDGLSIIDRRASRISKGVTELCKALDNIKLNNGITASVFPASHHRAVLRLRGDNLSSDISDTDPGTSGIRSGVLTCVSLSPQNKPAINTANALNEFSQRAQQILRQHPLNQERLAANKLPANGLLFRCPGMGTDVRNLISHIGLKAAVITGERTLNGLGKLSGFTVIQHAGYTGMADTDLESKFKAAKLALDDHDLVYVHIKATDIFSHSKDAKGKMEFIESIDNAMNSLSGMDCVIALSADHSTDSNTGNHCGEPVPSLIYSENNRVDGETDFGELACSRGGLGRLTAHEFILTVLDIMGRLPNYLPSNNSYFSGV